MLLVAERSNLPAGVEITPTIAGSCVGRYTTTQRHESRLSLRAERCNLPAGVEITPTIAGSCVGRCTRNDRVCCFVQLFYPGDGRTNRDVAGFQARRLAMQVEFQVHPGPENQAVGGTAKMEHPQRISLGDVLSNLDGDIAGGDFGHPNCHESH